MVRLVGYGWLVVVLAGCCCMHGPSHSDFSSHTQGGEVASPDATAQGRATANGSDEYRDARVTEVRLGKASYYHDSLAGNHTANGEIYDPRALTAASRNLPFGTVVRVVRVDTGAAVIVRINDRGPFGDRRRILDLSHAAAKALDMIRAGVVEIRAEILESAP